MSRVVIVAGARCGKSWLARELRQAHGWPTFCGDPLSTVKDPEPDVTYLPEGLPYSGDDGAAAWIVEHWLTMRGPWIVEGHVTARALRRWLAVDWRNETAAAMRIAFPCDRIIVFEHQRHDCDLKRGQVAMHKGVMRVWAEISEYFEPITEYR